MFVLKANPKKKLQLVKVLDKLTALFRDAKGTEHVLTMSQVEVANDLRQSDAKSIG